MFNAADESGDISDMPDIPGIGVWHNGHVGIYIGNDQVIQAMGTQYGVVRRNYPVQTLLIGSRFLVFPTRKKLRLVSIFAKKSQIWALIFILMQFVPINVINRYTLHLPILIQEVTIMRDIYAEYRQGLITWEEAYLTANNLAATVSSIPGKIEETDYWASQMESLGVDLAENMMKKLGYRQREDGVFFKYDDIA